MYEIRENFKGMSNTERRVGKTTFSSESFLDKIFYRIELFLLCPNETLSRVFDTSNKSLNKEETKKQTCQNLCCVTLGGKKTYDNHDDDPNLCRAFYFLCLDSDSSIIFESENELVSLISSDSCLDLLRKLIFRFFIRITAKRPHSFDKKD